MTDAERIPVTDAERLSEENRQLALEVKKLSRELKREKMATERNRISFEAKNRLSDIISAEKSRMEQFMELLLDNSRDYILLFDKAGHLAYCTESYLEACGIAGFGLIQNKNFGELLSDKIDEALREEIETYLANADRQGKPFEAERGIDFGGKGGKRIYLVGIRPMWDENAVVEGFMIIFYDTTDYVNAKKEAERANEAKSDFLASISHEIRTPMNAIIGIANMMYDTELSAQQRGYLVKIQNSSVVMLELINDILDFSKIEAGKLELLDEYFDFRELLEGIRSVFELMMEQKSLGFHCDFADGLPRVIQGDAKRIRQVLTNILNNAYKYTPSGWVDFHVRPGADGTIVFSVSDTGIGVKEEDLSKLFGEFVQLDMARNKNIAGTGLGLAITKRLAEMMRGSIAAESVYGQGSAFTVTLPLRQGTAADLPGKKARAMRFVAPGARILAVDDIEINLEIVQYMLKSFDVSCDLAMDGAEALRLVQDHEYDLVLMDHMMPVMNGIEATEHIRKLGGTKKDVPIVALTANAISGNEQMFKDMGFDSFISKPIDEDALAITLLELLPASLIQKS